MSAPEVDGSVDSSTKPGEGSPAAPPRQREPGARIHLDLSRAAAKLRLVERLLSGDERMLLAEVRAELEELAGPSAEVISFAGAPSRRRPT